MYIVLCKDFIMINWISKYKYIFILYETKKKRSKNNAQCIGNFSVIFGHVKASSSCD